jgi:D-threo-aldose 1-dehydrogenase
MGIGGAWLGHSGEGTFDEKTGVDTVLTGLESGMNFIDTSGAYIRGRSEQFIGIALEEWFSRGNRREDLIICSKTGTRVRPHDYSYDFTMKSVETSLEALGIDYLDMMLIHDPESLDPVFAEPGALSALRALKKEGVIGAIGLGCRRHDHHRACIEQGEFEVSLTFKDYNLLDQSALQGVIEPAHVHDVGIINASIMVNGILGGTEPKVMAERSRLHGGLDEETFSRAQTFWEWSNKIGLDLGVLNLHFCLRQEKIASTVLGFSKPGRVTQNVEALFTEVDDAIWPELHERFGLPA